MMFELTFVKSLKETEYIFDAQEKLMRTAIDNNRL